MPLAIVRVIMQFGQSLPTLFLHRTCSILIVSVLRTTFLSRHFLSRVLWMAMREYHMEEIEKYPRLGKCRGEEQVECNFVSFTQGRNYSRGIGDAWGPSKKEKVGSWHENQAKPKISFSHSFLRGPRGFFG